MTARSVSDLAADVKVGLEMLYRLLAERGMNTSPYNMAEDAADELVARLEAAEAELRELKGVKDLTTANEEMQGEIRELRARAGDDTRKVASPAGTSIENRYFQPRPHLDQSHRLHAQVGALTEELRELREALTHCCPKHPDYEGGGTGQEQQP